jgi:hypothetical protein
LSATLRRSEARYPAPDLQWLEDRFWVWVHYGATKIGRGELWEALDFLGFLRARVLGPLALQERGARPSGVRRLEQWAPELAAALRQTIATHDRRACLRALASTAVIYQTLRDGRERDGLVRRIEAERVAMEYLAAVPAGAPRAAQ